MKTAEYGKLMQYFTGNGYRPAPVDVSKPSVRIECPALEVDGNTLDRLHRVKHDIYDFLREIGYVFDEPQLKLGRESRLAHREGSAVKIMVTPNQKYDFIVVAQTLDVQPVSVSATTPRLSFYRPKPTRESTGNNIYHVRYGKQDVGRIYCEASEVDPNKQMWKAELFDGYDPLDYQDTDEPGEVPCVTCKDGDLRLVNNQALTVAQAKTWIRTAFDREQWESSLIAF